MLTMALLALMLSACGGGATPTPPAHTVVVDSGVTPLTASASATDDSVVVGDEDNAEVPAKSGAAPAGDDMNAPVSGVDGFPLLNEGDEVAARGILRIYAAAEPNVPTLDEYVAGDRFTILGPPDDVTIYPVELAGVRWYRVRASDGLVGWVIADGIEPVSNATP
ncbi:MAG TPA: SH3 domain-containing protein [Chloroflexi bacterium]|nr:SH3 domain-containing protein [Chloroflexota bacterium]